MAYSYPLMLDLSGKLAVVVGGGSVARRKVLGLLAGGAGRVRVVAPEVRGEMPPEVEQIAAAYEARYLDGAAIVFAATDSAEVNAAVVRDARRMGVLVNRADAEEGAAAGEGSDFTTPAVHRDGGVTVTVSASGSPALAARGRDEIAKRLPGEWGELAAVSQKLRPRVMGAVGDAARRREILLALAGDEALAAARRGGAAAVEAWAAGVFPELGAAAAAAAGGGGRG